MGGERRGAQNEGMRDRILNWFEDLKVPIAALTMGSACLGVGKQGGAAPTSSFTKSWICPCCSWLSNIMILLKNCIIFSHPKQILNVLHQSEHFNSMEPQFSVDNVAHTLLVLHALTFCERIL